MISLLFILFAALSVVFVVKSIKEYRKIDKDNDYNETAAAVCTVISVLLILTSIAFFIWAISLIIKVGTEHTIDEQIAMYEAENAAIEEKIDVIVKNYMDFEASTYAELKDDDAMNLVFLFPELKSDNIVQRQIEVHLANNERIKLLKLEKIDLSKAKFKLYFGR